ncbi:hypothetical protein QAD02_024328 [Eretmocerus hayati]|uniref:Uncharacterized protein n=1 Tax=Eretmocerus hayati TaxID=131215 RepID=A0ACC2PZG5_9HYME|nr:hypothetical protein QAD02_024328 [Eretmocerus hayati]
MDRSCDRRHWEGQLSSVVSASLGAGGFTLQSISNDCDALGSYVEGTTSEGSLFNTYHQTNGMWSQKLTHCDPWISSSAVAADDSYSLPFQDNFYVDPGFGIRDLNATPTVLYNEETSHRRFDQYKNNVDGNADYLPDNGILRSESHNILEIGALRFPANFAAADPDEIRHNPTQEQVLSEKNFWSRRNISTMSEIVVKPGKILSYQRNYRNVTSVIEMEVCLDAPLVKAYSSKPPLSVEKQKDIKTMMDKLTIPEKYHEYYAELLK